MGKNDFVLYEDNHLIAVYKDAGLPTVPDIHGDLSLLEKVKNYIKEKYLKPGNVYIGVLHRLDRPVSGVVLFARTSKGAARLTEQFKNRSINKRYYAIVEGLPDDLSGVFEDNLIKNTNRNKVKISDSEEGAFKAITEWKFISMSKIRGKACSLLEVRPITGRPHQIRVQLSHRGYPILGDAKYGSRIEYIPGKITLHAFEIEFTHPTLKTRIKINTSPPKDEFWKKFNMDGLNL